jgi:hypothetical protein
MNSEEENLFYQLQARNSQNESNLARMQQAVTLFSDKDDENLIKYQLDIEGELLRIERLLRKQKPEDDGKGNIIYVNPKKEDELLNEYGINETLNLLSWYLNKDIILSYYEDEQINNIMHNFSIQLSDLFFTNMEKFGLDTEEKKKHYPMIITNIVNIVDATYRRALNGRELESLKTARVVNQTQPLFKDKMYPSINSGRKFNILNPKSWRA